MTKFELRKKFRARRQQLSHQELSISSAHITANFFRSFDLAQIHFLHCFISIERFGEVDTRPIFQRIWSEFPHIQTAVPRINRETDELESLKYGPDVELVANSWQIGEPLHNDYVDPEKIDLVLVPLLCIDRQGHRVGYGKGYYDRFLGRCRKDCLKIGLSMFDPIDEITDAHEGDVKLDRAVTPSGIIRFGS